MSIFDKYKVPDGVAVLESIKDLQRKHFRPGIVLLKVPDDEFESDRVNGPYSLRDTVRGPLYEKEGRCTIADDLTVFPWTDPNPSPERVTRYGWPSFLTIAEDLALERDFQTFSRLCDAIHATATSKRRRPSWVRGLRRSYFNAPGAGLSPSIGAFAYNLIVSKNEGLFYFLRGSAQCYLVRPGYAAIVLGTQGSHLGDPCLFGTWTPEGGRVSLEMFDGDPWRILSADRVKARGKTQARRAYFRETTWEKSFFDALTAFPDPRADP